MSDYADKKSSDIVKVSNNNGHCQKIQIKQKFQSPTRSFYYFKENFIDTKNNVYFEQELIVDSSNPSHHLIGYNNYQFQPLNVLNNNISMEKILIYAIIFIIVLQYVYTISMSF